MASPENPRKDLSDQEWEAGTETQPGVKKSGTVMWRLSDAYWCRVVNGEKPQWRKMESTGRAEATSTQWIYVTGGDIKMKNQ
ncbi:hypothetical protein DM02DRAFT_621043 [Periconia macrospinosa]|uniref:Uncharacterized protein n=1 Tax=Periconia macrospinosa TaxID=97972 RepID=A0A2V1CXC5_9PLEO|nr:hypothetical protein DM02DRAFT_621043 [Periconia macrospinosa]